jgi:cytochrome bd-type quinol oxidase subunit 2
MGDYGPSKESMWVALIFVLVVGYALGRSVEFGCTWLSDNIEVRKR